MFNYTPPPTPPISCTKGGAPARVGFAAHQCRGPLCDSKSSDLGWLAPAVQPRARAAPACPAAKPASLRVGRPATRPLLSRCLLGRRRLPSPALVRARRLSFLCVDTLPPRPDAAASKTLQARAGRVGGRLVQSASPPEGGAAAAAPRRGGGGEGGLEVRRSSESGLPPGPRQAQRGPGGGTHTHTHVYVHLRHRPAGAGGGFVSNGPGRPPARTGPGLAPLDD